MKTVRIRIKIRDYLQDKPRNTVEIQEYINSTMRHGTTSQQLGNVLSKDKHTFKLGEIKRSGILSGGYDICEWGTSDWMIKNQDPENPYEIIYQLPAGSPRTYRLRDVDIKKLEKRKIEKFLEEEEKRKTLEELIA